MANLLTQYMGIELRNPLVVGACSVSNSIDNIKRVEEMGAGGLVIKSLFEEQIIFESLKLEEELSVGSESFGESLYYFPRLRHAGPRYHLMWVEKARKAVKMPLFGSLNAISAGNWTSYARQMEETGINGLELNVYAVQTDLNKEANQIERALYDVVEQVKQQVTIPVAVKISPFYTSVANVVAELDRRGVNALVLFNRFLQPDIDMSSESLHTEMPYSHPHEIYLPLRWIALLYGRINADLAATSGVHNSEAAIKLLLAGAKVVQIASVLYTQGIKAIRTILNEIEEWMEGKGYRALDDVRGKLSQLNVADPFLFERAQYVKILTGAA